MFSYAIWDSRRRCLMLARDRFGKKPLYFATVPHGFYFASELKCLGGLPVPYELDRDALQSFFVFGYLLEPETPYRAIRKLAAGSWLLYEADTGRVQQQTYWRPPVPAAHPPSGLSRGQAATELRERFDESVRIRMMADVPLGAFLSGGIDSSSVVASMALSQRPVNTFSIGFEENDTTNSLTREWSPNSTRHGMGSLSNR
jgi:asparagine synthase (glutamine-hydrolysing)